LTKINPADAITALRRNRADPRRAYIIILASAVAIGLLSLALAAPDINVWRHPVGIALNLLPPVLLAATLYCASGRAWIAILVPTLIVTILSAISFFKVQVRGEPLYAHDIVYATEAADAMQSFTLQWSAWLTLMLIVAALGTVICAFFATAKPRARNRVIGSVAGAVICAVLFLFVYSGDRVYSATGGSRGFLTMFLHSITVNTSGAPDDYDDDDAQNILAAYEPESPGIPDDRRVNVMSIMLESYADLSVYGGIDFKEDVYAVWHALQAESVHGDLIVNIFGGGTINTERTFLTGLPSTDIKQPIQSYVRLFTENGYYAEGFHAGDYWFYERATVCPNLGFDNYYFLQSYPDSTRNDDFFFPKLLELYNARDKSVPYFSHNLTFQNHGGYYTDQNYGSHLINQGNFTESDYNQLANYLAGINTTNELIAQFIDALRHDPEPVVVLLYGDHKPSLGSQKSVYRALGLDMDVTNEAGFYNVYRVPYIIWANDAAKAVLGTDFVGDGGDISPMFLMNELFDLCGWDGDAYMNLTDALRAVMPVVSVADGHPRRYVENGVLRYSPSSAVRDLYEDFEKAAYYRARLQARLQWIMIID
jgi:hypothetical protein